MPNHYLVRCPLCKRLVHLYAGSAKLKSFAHCGIKWDIYKCLDEKNNLLFFKNDLEVNFTQAKKVPFLDKNEVLYKGQKNFPHKSPLKNDQNEPCFSKKAENEEIEEYKKDDSIVITVEEENEDVNIEFIDDDNNEKEVQP